MKSKKELQSSCRADQIRKGSGPEAGQAAYMQILNNAGGNSNEIVTCTTDKKQRGAGSGNDGRTRKKHAPPQVSV